MITRSLSILVLAIGPACGADDGSPFVGDTAEGEAGPASDPSGTGTGTLGDSTAAGSDDPSGPDGTGDPSDTDGSTSTGADDGGGDGIGEWEDAPGACPEGTVPIELATIEELNAASRGEEPFVDPAPGTCYFILDGDYVGGEDPALYILHGGTAEQPIYWIGESREGVHITGRMTIDQDASHVVVSNLTLDLTGYENDEAFNTADVGEVQDVALDHITFTGDCATGRDGGHIESNGAIDLRIEACIIERYGRCGPEGHQDHGIYLAGGTDITIVNNVIRENASRGIQMYTQGGMYGTLDGITVLRNRIVANGHGDQEDGIVINATGTGTIANVSILHNLFHDNFFSGIRFAGPVTEAISVEFNTFANNSAGSSAEGRSEINIDEAGTAANATITGNIFAVGNTLINDCYGAAAMGFSIEDNIVDGPITGGDAGCVGAVIAEEPGFVDAAAGDFHTTNPAVASYGAYAPAQ